jgi:hypothetical protein
MAATARSLFGGTVETDADTEEGVAQVAENLRNDLNEALAPWRAIYEPMGWSVNLAGRVLHEDGRPGSS